MANSLKLIRPMIVSETLIEILGIDPNLNCINGILLSGEIIDGD